MDSLQDKCVLVTGVTGYLGTFCALELARRGCRVRGSVRSLRQLDEFRKSIDPLLSNPGRVQLMCADLTRDDSWDELVRGCDGILHVASPFPDHLVEDRSALIEAARGGTLRVLGKAVDQGVTRVVMTSSLVAMLEGRNAETETLDESVWGLAGVATDAYTQSKILAEQAAWQYVNEGPGRGKVALTTLLPGLLLGPLLSRDFSTSVQVILKLVRREFPGLPALGWNVVDVRDVACAHVDALVNSSAEGKRLACPGEFLWLVDLAKIINTLPQFSDRPLAVRSVPGFLVRLLALFDPQLKLASARLNRYEAVSDSAVVGTLGWSRRPVSTTIADTVASIFDLGLNKK